MKDLRTLNLEHVGFAVVGVAPKAGAVGVNRVDIKGEGEPLHEALGLPQAPRSLTHGT